MSGILGRIGAAVGNFFGPSPATQAGSVNATDLFKSAVIPLGIAALAAVVPGIHAPGLALAAVFALDLLRRLPHDTTAFEEAIQTPGLGADALNLISHLVSGTIPAASPLIVGSGSAVPPVGAVTPAPVAPVQAETAATSISVDVPVVLPYPS